MSVTRRTVRLALPALLLAVCLGQASQQTAKAADLFYNYYAPSAVGGPPAQLYLSPRPTPPLVGHTYITYQPLYPHEYMYCHSRVYVGYDGRRLPANRTRVVWWSSPVAGLVQHFIP